MRTFDQSQQQHPEHILLIMLDGVGLPPEPLEKSIYADCPTLRKLFSEHSTPVDAQLGVPGTPQSATGQTAILTGLNAAGIMNSHREGFPGPALRAVVEEHNIFRQLKQKNLSATFANAYVTFPENKIPMMFRSVTTVAALASLPRTRSREDLLQGRAVYHDITRQILHAEDARVAVITETEAALDLWRTARTVDMCLFEFFMTDHAGHRGTLADKKRVLASLDRFCNALLQELRTDSELLLVVSDHGNIEALHSKGHTDNPVPFAAVGKGAVSALEKVKSLVDLTPLILHLLTQ